MGNFIRTGKIESTDGLTYFDLDNNIIHGKIEFTSGTGGYDNIDDKPDLGIYAEITVTDDLQDQVDGKIISYFQEADPNTWEEGDRPAHDGDMWYKASTHLLKRYKADTNEWTLIEDQKAIDAYADAATAQDTADGKRRVFTTTPTTPYDVGDLWAAGPSGDLKRCKTARASGAYEATDWELASNYTDDTIADSKAKVFRQPTAPTSGMVAGDFWIDTDDGDKMYTYNGSIWIQAYTIIDGGNIEAGSLSLISAASDYDWGNLPDDGNKPDNDADVTGSNTAADIINLPATPAGAGLYATGSYLGYYDGAAWKAYIQGNGYFYFKGDANNYIQWNGSSLAIKGSITLINTIPNAKVDGLGNLALENSLAYGDIEGTKPPSNADVTLSALNGSLAITGGGITLQGGGAIKSYGKNSFTDTTAGFFLGYDSGYKLNIGSYSQYIKWNGSNLTIKGSITLENTIPSTDVSGLGGLATEDDVAYGDITGTKPPSNADVTLSAINGSLAITGGGITLQGGGAIKSYGKDSYTDTTAGFFLGYDSGYKLNIGNATDYLKWSGSALTVHGKLYVGGGTNEDIYFEDSEIRMYDAESGYYKQIMWKYGTINFAKLTHWAVAIDATSFHLYSKSGEDTAMVCSDGAGSFVTTAAALVLGAGNKNFNFYNTGQLQLPNLSSYPTSNLAEGQICMCSGTLRCLL